MLSMVDNSVNISDSVITGDVTNIVNTNRITCEVCKATGNLTIFTCSEKGCGNTFCEHCRSSTHPNICKNCNIERSNQHLSKNNNKFLRNKITRLIIIANIACVVSIIIILLLFNL